ncbi:uncharacterized protein LOC133380810 isoform X2 [Rhineura floridana]|nr:uncharacterized protein LOC133380810 isoform X2 [Rhineura floridana]XP_061474843.1 uncharacterized protein LOC133380810 isoform X2 [Rhineura floridana]XP_061474844.1 uncharacterized protein LOC133380810 isoform X2 [Rhineura floridana]XP_061474845.1 uncharacterized protein LOC133380810 isoform X2 [Rhineura floridana]XP_061474846.1 uncharacterized protein LOC133380810 isoform X2 [Rhineura floridana]XP_061474847.1 uncharacterized protein LOC133380810 isoform X2 [Rhineura floridana]
MSDATALRVRDPSGSWTVEDDISGTDTNTLKPKLMPVCAEMAPELMGTGSVSNSSSLRKGKIYHSGTGGNGIRNSVEEDKITRPSYAERQHGQSPPKKGDEKMDCWQLGTNTCIVPRPVMILSPKKRKLVLHIDLNNTILVSDAITGQDPRAALNYFLSTVTWGKISPTGEWQWLSESPSLHPPCQGAVSFYSQYGRNTKFTDVPLGRQFYDLHRRHLGLLEWQGQPHPLLSSQDEQAKHYHLVLPSFFHLLESLHQEKRRFAVVFRTFGTDLPRVLQAVRCALEGEHPCFPALRDISLPVDLSPGKIRCSKRKVVVTQGVERLSTEDGDRRMHLYFSSREGLCGFQDHFGWWAKNEFSSQGGKPLWIDPYDASVHHICIDDNIRLNDSDTIIHPQVFTGQGSSCLRTTPTSELYNVCLVQTDLLEAISDMSYFCHCIRRCEENYDSYLASSAGNCI